MSDGINQQSERKPIRGLYLASKQHRISKEGFAFKYNDIIGYDDIDYKCSLEEVPLDGFDVYIATPPCNYYSKANYPAQREGSKIAQQTKHLLPWCLDNLPKTGRPFLVENVLNMSTLPVRDNLYMFSFGGHMFYSNLFFLVRDHLSAKPQHKRELSYGYRDNNYNVHLIIDCFLEAVEEYYASLVL